MDEKIRSLMTVHSALYPRDYIDYMCQEKKEEEDLPTLWSALMKQFEG